MDPLQRARFAGLRPAQGRVVSFPVHRAPHQRVRRCWIPASRTASRAWRRSSPAMRAANTSARYYYRMNRQLQRSHRTAAPGHRRLPGRRFPAPRLPAQLVQRPGQRQGSAGNRRGGRGLNPRPRRILAAARHARRRTNGAKWPWPISSSREFPGPMSGMPKRSNCASTGAFASPTPRNASASATRPS